MNSLDVSTLRRCTSPQNFSTPDMSLKSIIGNVTSRRVDSFKVTSEFDLGEPNQVFSSRNKLAQVYDSLQSKNMHYHSQQRNLKPSNETLTAQQSSEKQFQQKIMSLEQEIECLKREKNFIVQRQKQSVDELAQIDVERQRANLAERAYLQLKAEIDLIQDELNLESQNIEKCRKFLEPDEAARFNEKHSISPQSQLATGHTVLHKLTVSEQILFKYKRSNELRQFFESIYQQQQKTIGDLGFELQ